MTDFERGHLVECVDGDFGPKERRIIPNRPIAGGRYRIRALSSGGRGVGILLVELTNPQIVVYRKSDPDNFWMMEPPFLATRFRLVRPISIEALRALLKVDELTDA